MIKCIRPFRHHDLSFSWANVAVPSIQSTPSIILDSSTSAVVPSTILISASVVPTLSLVSEGKFFSFGALSDEQNRTIYLPFLGTWTSAIQQISEILLNIYYFTKACCL